MASHAHAIDGSGDHPTVGHLVPLRILFATGAALLFLTVITVAVRYIDLGNELNVIVAIGIAVVKATLVCLYFMHLRWDRPFNILVVVGCIAFVLLLIALALMDTTQYEPLLKKGNAPAVEAAILENAPVAPIAKESQATLN